MRFQAYLLAASSCLLAAWQAMPSRRPVPATVSYCDCPQPGIRFNPYEAPSFFAARFLVAGKLYVPAGPLAERTIGDCQVSQQLRFGALFLAEGNHSEGAGRSPHPLVCVRGNDTMIVYISPLNSWVNSLYDSIPFRPGRYSLVQLREDKIITTPYRLQEKSFSTYYAQHVAELQRANPFAGCQFAPHTLDPGRDPTAYFPPTPADLFRLLLVYNRYLSIRPWKLRPITALEQRALDRASFAH